MDLKDELWAALFGGLILITFPLLAELLVLSLAALLPRQLQSRRRLRLPPVERLLVVVPAHNEESGIGRCIESIASSNQCASRILVIAHNCSDGTAAIASKAGAAVYELNDLARVGKGHALKQGFECAFRDHGADAVLVIDADSEISPNLVPSVLDGLRSAMAVQCRYDLTSSSDATSSRLRAFGILCMNMVRAKGRSNLGLSCGVHGTGMAFRRTVFDQVPYLAQSIVEDLEFHLHLVAAGIYVSYLPEAVVSSDPPPDFVSERTQSARWEGGRLRMLLTLGPKLLRSVPKAGFASLEPLLDLAAAPTSIELLLLALAACLPLSLAKWYACAGISIILLHILVGLSCSSDPHRSAKDLLSAPFYVLRKLLMVPQVVRMSRANAHWERTARVSIASSIPTEANATKVQPRIDSMTAH